jgi:carbon-monoxide dehydrogenase large subunit
MPRDDGIGAAVRRKEDFRFVTGQGSYTDDLNRPGQTYAAFVRSPHAHATLNSVGTAAAAGMDGVVAVFTGQDLADAEVNGLPCGWQVHSKDGEPMVEPAHPALAQGKVRHVGDAVAVVIAETPGQAQAAAEAVEVDYGVLPGIGNMTAAKAGKAQVHEEAANNQCYDWELGDEAEIDAAMAKAAHVVELPLVNNRLIANPIEPRVAIGDYDTATGEHTLYTTSQNPHVIRLLMGAFVLGLPEHKLRVVAPDVGGGFGTKIFHYAEEAIVTWAAAKVRRPIKWTSDRSEAFMTDAHGRDHETVAKLGLDADGKFLALKVQTDANMGAYLSTFAPAVPTYLYATLLAGQYTTPLVYANVRAWFTNTVPVDAYRGAGRPEATYVIERIVEEAARQIGMDPADLRAKNFVAPDAFPYQTPVALEYDSGNYAGTLEMAKTAIDYAGFPARQAASKAAGKLRGIGFSAYIEACGIAPSAVVGSLGARAGLYEVANVRVHPTGSVTMHTGTHSHGQGHETTFAQVIAERLGVPIENVDVVHGDTNNIPFGMGTYGSRSLAVGGSALAKALDKVEAKAKKIAAHLMEASDTDVEFKDGQFTIAGTDKSVAFGDVALTAYVPHNFPHDELEPGLEEQAFYDPANFTFPAGCHIAEVEIDPDTGTVTLANFVAADDFGNIVNPMIVEGQVHGGIAQGVGQALLEGCVYDEDGQLVTGSYMDYAMPRADNLPNFTVDTQVTPCPHNPLGVKGCGEAGAIAAPAAVMNAVTGAMRAAGVTKPIDMPATPSKVWAALNAS